MFRLMNPFSTSLLPLLRLALVALAGVLAAPVDAATIPGTVSLRSGKEIQAQDIQIGGLEEPQGIEFTIDGTDYHIDRAEIATLAFHRIRETDGGLIGPDSRIEITFRSGKTVTASEALLSTRVRVTYQGELVNETRTRVFTINGSEGPTVADPDDIVRIRFKSCTSQSNASSASACR